MRRSVLIAFLILAACGGKESTDSSIYELNREPVSVRGWILDVKGSKHGETAEMEIARRQQVFQATSLWVENAQYASGGIAENGAFIVLDVPPNKSIIGVNAPGAETARIVMEGVPGTSDVIIPDVILERGGATVLDPKKIVVRLPAKVDKPTPTGKTATIAGYKVPIVQTPIGQMTDRRDYPNPGGFRPVAVVK
ncbi:MAG TPA: hypothetical protein VJZ00_14575 [Thermoanaerobaculia bacterium]|nr:hypothetical protein [Thermoanaerobaculia bacterium]